MPVTTARRTEIEALADETLRTALGADAKPPVNISDVVSSLGLTLKVGEFNDRNTLGALDRTGKVIAVSKKDDYVRQAFTVAHEVGHFVLHADKADDVFYRKDFAELDQEHTEMETEANMFAAALLMPESWVRTAWPVFHNTELMAQSFRVSYSAMKWRLTNLGLL